MTQYQTFRFRIVGVLAEKIRIRGAMPGFRGAFAAVVGPAASTIEQLNSLERKDLLNQRADETRVLAGTIQEQDSTRRLVEPFHVAPLGDGFARS